MIRKVEKADLPECVRVIRESFRTVADEFGFTPENAPRFTAFATTEQRLAWQMYCEHRLMYLDEEGGQACGYYSLQLRENSECELGNLSVLPGFRHRGIGGKLLRHAIETAGEQRCTAIKLSIVEENKVLREWYEQNGAVHTGTEKFDFFPFTCGYMEIALPDAVPEPAACLLRLLTERSAAILGENLTGIYLHGSAAMGCWNPAKSDLDLIVVVRDTPDDDCKRAYMEMVAELSGMLPGKKPGHSGIEMSIVRRDACDPFVYPTPFELHFSAGHLERYRRDPEKYIREMKGTDRDLAAHFTVIRRRGRCLAGEPVGNVFGEVPAEDYLDSIRYDIEEAQEEITGNPVYYILNLARVLAFRTEGKILSKQEGGEWALRRLPEKYHPLIRTALADYGSDTEARYDPAAAREYAEYMLGRIGEKTGGPGV